MGHFYRFKNDQLPAGRDVAGGVEVPQEVHGQGAYVGSPTQLSNYLTLKGSFSAAAAVDRTIFKN